MSIFNFILKNYIQIPLGLTNFLAPFYYLIPEKIRYGKVYRSETKEIQRIDTLGVAESETEKDKALSKLISYAYNHVPYYHELFDNNGIKPNEINGENDLYRIPYLTKEILTKNKDKLISDEINKSSLVHITTSGSTGEPTGFFVQNESAMRDWVYVQHMFRDFGFRLDSSKMVMRGKAFWAQKEKNRNWQWDALKRELSINIFNMTPENMEDYCCAIEKYKPQFAYGYMSAMYMLCKYINVRNGGLNHQFKGCLGISETIWPEQREFIEHTINARVFSFYGMSERVIIGGECYYSTEYHIEPLYGICELIDKVGHVITKPGIEGEIVGTSLLNYAMPLIRYKMGDLASWSDKEECECGSYKKRLKSVSGRAKNDMLVNHDGQLISMASLEVHSRIYNYMSRYQFVQEKPGEVVIKVVPLPDIDLTDSMVAEIQKVFTDRTMGKIVFMAEVVDAIKPKANGKLSIVDQRLEVSQYT